MYRNYLTGLHTIVNAYVSQCVVFEDVYRDAFSHQHTPFCVFTTCMRDTYVDYRMLVYYLKSNVKYDTVLMFMVLKK